MLRWNQDSEGREKSYSLDKSAPQSSPLCNKAQGMLITAALQAQKEFERGLSNYAYSLANKPSTATLLKCNRNSGLVFTFITAKCVPITHHYHNQFYHQLFEIQAHYYFFLRPCINSITPLRAAPNGSEIKTIHCSYCSSWSGQLHFFTFKTAVPYKKIWLWTRHRFQDTSKGNKINRHLN